MFDDEIVNDDNDNVVVALAPSVLAHGHRNFEPVGRAHAHTSTRMLGKPRAVETWNSDKDADVIQWLQKEYPKIKVNATLPQHQKGCYTRIGSQVYLPPSKYVDGLVSEIIPRLYIAGLFATHTTLKESGKPVPGNLNPACSSIGITHIIHIHDDEDPCSGKIFNHDLVFNLTERSGACEQMMAALPDCWRFIHNALKDENNRVLVHCYAGKNRSATVIASYLLLTGHCDHVDEVLYFMRARHSMINPMKDFLALLHTLRYMKPLLAHLIQ